MVRALRVRVVVRVRVRVRVGCMGRFPLSVMVAVTVILGSRSGLVLGHLGSGSGLPCPRIPKGPNVMHGLKEHKST